MEPLGGEEVAEEVAALGLWEEKLRPLLAQEAKPGILASEARVFWRRGFYRQSDA